MNRITGAAIAGLLCGIIVGFILTGIGLLIEDDKPKPEQYAIEQIEVEDLRGYQHTLVIITNKKGELIVHELGY
jgi:hypothetical protein